MENLDSTVNAVSTEDAVGNKNVADAGRENADNSVINSSKKDLKIDAVKNKVVNIALDVSKCESKGNVLSEVSCTKDTKAVEPSKSFSTNDEELCVSNLILTSEKHNSEVMPTNVDLCIQNTYVSENNLKEDENILETRENAVNSTLKYDIVKKEKDIECISSSGNTEVSEETSNRDLKKGLKDSLELEHPDRREWHKNTEIEATSCNEENEKDYQEILKDKKRKHSVELKLKNLKWTLNQSSEVTGPRQKRPPQRLDLGHLTKRKSGLDFGEGQGEPLGTIPWIVQQVREGNLYTLRLLHRVIFRKQGMFSEKHIKKSILSFKGFPFDASSSDMTKRKEPLEKANFNGLASLCDMLGVKCGSKAEMIDGILGFLLTPSKKKVDDFLKEVVFAKSEQEKAEKERKMLDLSTSGLKMRETLGEEEGESEDCSSSSRLEDVDEDRGFTEDVDVSNTAWKKPTYFVEGTGVKLKYIKAIMGNIQIATDSFIELLHKLLFLNTDERYNMRRNILEFSGFKCEFGTAEYLYRTRLLSMLPLDQIKFICRVLCLPTWHRSRQLLIEGIMDFLAVPRISAMKKRLPPSVSEDVPIPHDIVKKIQSAEIKFQETEEIEIVPDIHIPEQAVMHAGKEFTPETNDISLMKLKNFPNVHYQVISTPAVKLNDVHMILYFRPCPPNNVRKNILEFSGFPFNEHSTEFQCRRALMEQMNLAALKTVATVFCVSPYIVDKTKENIIEAVLNFLLNPSAILKGTTSTPVIVGKQRLPVITQAGKFGGDDVVFLSDNEEESSKSKYMKLQSMPLPIDSGISDKVKQSLKSVVPGCTLNIEKNLDKNMNSLSKESVEEQKGGTSTSFVMPTNLKQTPAKSQKRVTSNELDEPLAKVQKTVNKSQSLCQSDDDSDEPLSNLVGHPNDDQLRLLIKKIIDESKLEEITMKKVIRMVFNTYPNFELGYRKEFIKSTVRQILSQMGEQSCSVSTTVLTV